MDILKTLATIGLVVAIVSFILGLYLKLPVVIKSYSTGECLAVLSDSKEFGCDNMPKKYILEWAK